MKLHCRADIGSAAGLLAVLLLAAATVAPASAQAMPSATVGEELRISPGRERERELLLRFVAEMEAAEIYLHEARRNGETGHYRRNFDYDRLTDDLQLMRQGVLGYLRQSGSLQPRSFESLSGDYMDRGTGVPR